ncbi:hypothetical protein D3C72_1028710 [compost metagenome]
MLEVFAGEGELPEEELESDEEAAEVSAEAAAEAAAELAAEQAAEQAAGVPDEALKEPAGADGNDENGEASAQRDTSGPAAG